MQDLPDLLSEVIQAPALKRLERIDMNCGLVYTSLPRFCNLQPYSRYDHSLGVAALAWRFSGNAKAALAALFHDLSTPAFSHVVDFMHGDHEKQEYTEQLTASMIKNDPVICRCLETLGIELSEVADYHMYPVADNDSPKLSCDRLEYTLENMVRYGLESEELKAAVAEDLVVGMNDTGEEELQFQSVEIAERFALASVACGRIYSGAEDRYAMEMLARLLKRAIGQGVIAEELLYKDEPRVIAALHDSPMREAWAKYRRLHAVEITEEDGSDVISVSAKKRYIDPYVKDRGRISLLSSAFEEALRAFTAEDYSVKLKGEF